MKRRSLVLALLALAASAMLAALLSVTEPGRDPSVALAPAAAPAHVNPRRVASVPPRPLPVKAATTPRISAEQVTHATGQLWPESAYTEPEYDQTKVEIYRAFQAISQDWTVETYSARAARRDELSGREIYELYTYLRACHQQPRSVADLNRQEQRIRSSTRMAQRLSAEEIDQIVAGYRAELIRCESLPDNGELTTLMLDWLTLSAMRGFPQAQIAYHRSARWLLSQDRWGVYRHPERVREYGRLAPVFLEAALKSGHHDALYEYSIALRENVIFEEDPLAAYAYAWAANLARGGGNPEAREIMALLETVLTPDDIRDARQHGRELCDTYCRPNV